MHRIAVLIAATIACAPLVARAGGWEGIDHALLPGHAIIATGEATKRSKMTDDFQQVEWFEFQGRCFVGPAGFSFFDGDSIAAMLLVDRNQTQRIALLKAGIAGVDIDVSVIRWVSCPSLF